jgi:hypothetical protein
MVNRKGLHPYYALNRVFVVAFSNERVAISIPSEDRRWFVIWAEASKLPEAQAVSLWNWYQHRGGFEAVAHYLHTRDVSAWNPTAPPPMTEAKAIMVEHGMSTAESFLVDLMRRRAGEFSRGVVGGPFMPSATACRARLPQAPRSYRPRYYTRSKRPDGWTWAGSSRATMTAKSTFFASVTWWTCRSQTCAAWSRHKAMPPPTAST